MSKQNGNKGRRFDRAFKEEAVRPLQTSGRRQRQIAGDLGISVSALGRWVTELREEDLLSGPHEDAAKEITRLRRERDLACQEREPVGAGWDDADRSRVRLAVRGVRDILRVGPYKALWRGARPADGAFGPSGGSPRRTEARLSMRSATRSHIPIPTKRNLHSDRRTQSLYLCGETKHNQDPLTNRGMGDHTITSPCTKAAAFVRRCAARDQASNGSRSPDNPQH